MRVTLTSLDYDDGSVTDTIDRVENTTFVAD